MRVFESLGRVVPILWQTNLLVSDEAQLLMSIDHLPSHPIEQSDPEWRCYIICISAKNLSDTVSWKRQWVLFIKDSINFSEKSNFVSKIYLNEIIWCRKSLREYIIYEKYYGFIIEYTNRTEIRGFLEGFKLLFWCCNSSSKRSLLFCKIRA